MRFFSDNTATACPEILAALGNVNHGRAKSYGEDDWTLRLDEAFGVFFGAEVKVFAMVTGTASNALSIGTLATPFGMVFAHEGAHLINDEYGAAELFSGGAKLVGVAGANGKLTPETLGAAIARYSGSVHSLQPTALSLTQATELGTSYRPGEIAALTALARRHRIKVHMDGARFANSLEFLGCSPADITWRAGVDVLSFGATKNGALAAEAVVFFNRDLVQDFELRRRRAGHLVSKARFVSAQLLAYLENDVWRRNAARSNGFARQVGAAASAALLHPVEANELFLNLGTEGMKRLREAGFEFHPWGADSSGHARFVVSWDQPESDVAALCQALARR
ncbi:MAG TPA: beta-eliminating lyase-related protein [Steroidobacteraceae bacterium]|nr:beta-eliminating lyase-related protein [Steroidobacteraceae bacterium]